MYHAIVRQKVRKTWRRIGAGDYSAAVEMAASDIHFTFLGDTALHADLHGPAEFGAWFERLFATFDNLHFAVEDLVVRGWPWRTRVVLRLGITARLPDGGTYRNTAAQWVTLRWGRMTEDLVLEDTLKLAAALRGAAPAA